VQEVLAIPVTGGGGGLGLGWGAEWREESEGITRTCSPTEETDGDGRILKRGDRRWSSVRPNCQRPVHQGAWVSGAPVRGGEGGHDEGLTGGEKEGRRSESSRWRRRRSLEVAGRAPSGCEAPLVLQRREGRIWMRVDKEKLRAVSVRYGDASSRQIGERTHDTPCVSNDGGAARGEKRSRAKAS
jgi:hypothetical protein